MDNEVLRINLEKHLYRGVVVSIPQSRPEVSPRLDSDDRAVTTTGAGILSSEAVTTSLPQNYRVVTLVKYWVFTIKNSLYHQT